MAKTCKKRNLATNFEVGLWYPPTPFAIRAKYGILKDFLLGQVREEN